MEGGRVKVEWGWVGHNSGLIYFGPSARKCVRFALHFVKVTFESGKGALRSRVKHRLRQGDRSVNPASLRNSVFVVHVPGVCTSPISGCKQNSESYADALTVKEKVEPLKNQLWTSFYCLFHVLCTHVSFTVEVLQSRIWAFNLKIKRRNGLIWLKSVCQGCDVRIG